jgi:hypothetical protein
MSRNGRSAVGYSNLEAVSDRDILSAACNVLNSVQTEYQFSQLTCTHAPSVNDNAIIGCAIKIPRNKMLNESHKHLLYI